MVTTRTQSSLQDFLAFWRLLGPVGPEMRLAVCDTMLLMRRMFDRARVGKELQDRQEKRPLSLSLNLGFRWACKRPSGLAVSTTEHGPDANALRRTERRFQLTGCPGVAGSHAREKKEEICLVVQPVPCLDLPGHDDYFLMNLPSVHSTFHPGSGE